MANNSEVHLYVNASDPKMAYKDLSNEVTITESFRMKEPVDQLNPVFTIARSTMQAVNHNWADYNYCMIPRFMNRKYFMTTKALNDGLIECSCKVDALSTYIEALKGKSFEVARYENADLSNLYADDQQPIYANTALQWHVLGSLDEDTSTSNNHYVMTVAGG